MMINLFFSYSCPHIPLGHQFIGIGLHKKPLGIKGKGGRWKSQTLSRGSKGSCLQSSCLKIQPWRKKAGVLLPIRLQDMHFMSEILLLLPAPENSLPTATHLGGLVRGEAFGPYCPIQIGSLSGWTWMLCEEALQRQLRRAGIQREPMSLHCSRHCSPHHLFTVGPRDIEKTQLSQCLHGELPLQHIPDWNWPCRAVYVWNVVTVRNLADQMFKDWWIRNDVFKARFLSIFLPAQPRACLFPCGLGGPKSRGDSIQRGRSTYVSGYCRASASSLVSLRAACAVHCFRATSLSSLKRHPQPLH